ncbi:zinc finger BED domain-containing protein 4-like [Oratosquilla oratoria]|uniref:zinc finger BED domain-containing protein 4-like n=1 Tax=Oratosquilla oratoria TaxID=337810 RepID=UPI003F76F39F
MIAEDLQPVSVVEDKGFRRLLHGLNPRYQLPSRREISRTLLPNLYKHEVEKMRKELDQAKHISLTTDIWTSRQTKGFITVTAHFISQDWTLHSAVLETVCMTKAHTSENIAEELTLVSNKWNIKEKICSIVTDNAANIKAAVNEMNIRQVPCFAHTLNLVVQDAIRNTADVRKVKEKVKRVVTFFHHSVKASDKLIQLQQQHNHPVKKLLQDVDTRWNSTYYMMERYLEQSELVTTTLCLLGRNDLCLSADENMLLQSAVHVLEPFEEATKEMSTEKVTSLSKIIPMVRGIHDYMISCEDHDHPTDTTSLAKELQVQTERRFSIIEGKFLMAASTFLDPRFKKVPFANSSNVKKVEDSLIGLMRTEETPTASTSTRQNKPATSMPQQRKKSLWNRFDSKIKKNVKWPDSTSHRTAHCNEEVRREASHRERRQSTCMVEGTRYVLP